MDHISSRHCRRHTTHTHTHTHTHTEMYWLFCWQNKRKKLTLSHVRREKQPMLTTSMMLQRLSLKPMIKVRLSLGPFFFIGQTWSDPIRPFFFAGWRWKTGQTGSDQVWLMKKNGPNDIVWNSSSCSLVTSATCLSLLGAFLWFVTWSVKKASFTLASVCLSVHYWP